MGKDEDMNKKGLNGLSYGEVSITGGFFFAHHVPFWGKLDADEGIF